MSVHLWIHLDALLTEDKLFNFHVLTMTYCTCGSFSAPPYTTTLPDDVAVRVGEVIRLQCLAHGTPPMRFEWNKVDGRLPTRAKVQGGDLQINLASPSDAGTYKCVASNKVGRSEAVAKVSVRCE